MPAVLIVLGALAPVAVAGAHALGAVDLAIVPLRASLFGRTQSTVAREAAVAADEAVAALLEPKEREGA